MRSSHPFAKGSGPNRRRSAAKQRRHRALRLEFLEDRSLLAAFTPGNLVIERVGDLSPNNANLVATGSPVFLDEFTPSGALVQTIALPKVQEGPNLPLVANGQRAEEGALTLSADGRYLFLTGYARALVPPPSGVLHSTQAISVNRTIGRVDWLGNVDTSMGLSDLESGVNTIASYDGSQVWVAASNGAVKRAIYGFNISTFVIPTGGSAGRQLHIFEDQLYLSTSTRIAKVGNGLPTEPASLSGPTELNLTNAFGFFFADLSVAVGGLDTLYVASDGTAALSKYSLYDGVWTLTGTIGTTSDDYRGLTASVSGTTVTLYAVAGGGTGTSGGGKLVKLVDASGYNGPLVGTPTEIASAANQTAFRGVAWVPHADNNAPIYNTAGNPALPGIAQNAVTNPGVLIAELIASGDGNPITDLDPGALEGIALVAADTSAGQWEYSLNDGGTWSQVGEVSLSSARLLAADAATRIRLVPNGTFTGTLPDALRFRAWDQTAGSNGGLSNPLGHAGADGAFSVATETASIEVIAYTNVAPTIGVIGAQEVNEDGSILVDFVVGDDGDPASLVVGVSSSDPAILPTANIVLGGSGANRTALITPAANAFGMVTVTITVSDGELARSAEFQLSVISMNDLPAISAVADRSTAEDIALPPITLELSDLDELSQLTLEVSSDNPTLFPAANLVLAGTGMSRTLTATPAANQHGAANVTLTVTDSAGGIATRTFVITVTAVNDPPVLAAFADLSIDEDQTSADIQFAVMDQETAAASLQIAFASSDPLLLPPESFILEGTGANRTLRIAPAQNRFGVAIITVTLTDGSGGQDVETFEVTVNAVNDRPTVAAIADQTTTEDVSILNIPIVPADLETEVTDLEIVATSSDEDLFPTSGLIFGSVGPNWSLTLVPSANTFGSATITVNVKDEQGLSTTTSFTATVTAVNDPPTLSPIDDANTSEDTSLPDISLTIADQETAAEALTVSVTSSDPQLFAAEGMVVIGSGATRFLRLNPTLNRFGTAVIQFTVTDADNQSTTGSFNVSVDAVNDAPSITAVGDLYLSANEVAGPISVTLEDVDHAAESLVFTVQSSNLDLIPLERIAVAGSGESRTLTITPVKNQSGTATITLNVKDAAGLQTTTTFQVAVAANEVPTITPIADRAILEDEFLGDVSFAIGDQETGIGELVVSVSSDNLTLLPANAFFVVEEGTERTLQILPAADQFGSATVTITVTDENGASVSRSFQVEVSPVNDAPIALETTLPVSQEQPSSAAFVAVDVDGPTLTYELASLPRRGIVTITNPATGAYIYRPYPGEHGRDRFNFRVRDGQAVSNLATVLVEVEPFQPTLTLAAGVLTILGTPNDDFIAVAPLDESSVIAIVGSNRFGPFPTPERIRLFGEGGRDALLVHNLTIPTDLDYGEEPAAWTSVVATSTPSTSLLTERGWEGDSFGHLLAEPGDGSEDFDEHAQSSASSTDSTAILPGLLADLALLQILQQMSVSPPHSASLHFEPTPSSVDADAQESLFEADFFALERTLSP